jgi:hypothetical protein
MKTGGGAGNRTRLLPLRDELQCSGDGAEVVCTAVWLPSGTRRIRNPSPLAWSDEGAAASSSERLTEHKPAGDGVLATTRVLAWSHHESTLEDPLKDLAGLLDVAMHHLMELGEALSSGLLQPADFEADDVGRRLQNLDAGDELVELRLELGQLLREDGDVVRGGHSFG